MGNQPTGASVLPFAVKDCALSAIATAEKAQNLRELRDRLRTIHAGAIYYHFWGRVLRPQFDNPAYLNDFAEWAWTGLHDPVLAERLGVIDPTDLANEEALRQELIDVIEQRLDESEFIPWAKADHQFSFIRSQIVVFDTGHRVGGAEELAEAVEQMSVGSVFYHFIDARRRAADSADDFRTWLAAQGQHHAAAIDALADVDLYFGTLPEVRTRIVAALRSTIGPQAESPKDKKAGKGSGRRSI